MLITNYDTRYVSSYLLSSCNRLVCADSSDVPLHWTVVPFRALAAVVVSREAIGELLEVSSTINIKCSEHIDTPSIQPRGSGCPTSDCIGWKYVLA